jgi:serine protease Do
MKSITLRMLLALVCAAGVASGAHGANPLLKQIEDAFIEIGDSVRPFVVNIDVVGSAPENMGDMRPEGLEEFFKQYMQVPEGHPRPPAPRASGSGFIYDAQGHIITNNHVVDRAETVRVTLWNDETVEAEIVGQDPQTDIAVIKINVDFELTPARLGNSDALKVGQFAIAVGSPRGFKGSLSFGHVTALGREGLRLPGLRFQSLIQTDAAINLGNSGGPLCDIDGQVIGINTAIVYAAESLGFAVPINNATKVVPLLIRDGKITRGYLGVQIRDAAEFADVENLPDGDGAYVEFVMPDTPADRAGIKVYDVIRKVNGTVVANSQDLIDKVSDLPPDSTATVEVWRNGDVMEFQVSLDEFPEGVDEVKKEKPLLGMRVRPLTPEIADGIGLKREDLKGVVVSDVEPGSAADEAQIRRGDIIVEIAKQPVTSPEDFRNLLATHGKPGAQMLVRLVRAGQGGENERVVILKVPDDAV